jgi:NHLM bacteriocin system ABC transporter peptidase/ATP-binding protein
LIESLKARFAGRRHARPVRIKTPTVLQMEAVECGAASLAIMLAAHGRWVPLADLRRDCGVSRDGSKASNVLAAARRYGMKAKGFKKSLEGLQDLRPPFIVFWNFNHFLVVEGFGDGRVWLNDPSAGRRSVTLAEFDEAYTGVVLVLEPGPEFVRGGHRPSIVKALRRRLAGHYPPLLYCMLVGLLLVVPGLAVPVFSQIFVDRILVEGLHDWLQPLLIGMAVTAGLDVCLYRLRTLHLRRLKLALSVGLSTEFLWHLFRLPAGFYAQRFAGEIASRFRLNDNVAAILSGRLAITAIDALMVLFYGAMMLFYDVPLTLVAMAFAVVNVLVLRWLSHRRADASLALQVAHGKVAGTAIAGLQAIETLKASASEGDFFTKWAGYNTAAINASQRFAKQELVLGLLPGVVGSLSTLSLLVIGGLRVMDGHLSIGMLTAFQSLTASFLAPVASLMNLGSTLQTLQSDISRLDDVLGNQALAVATPATTATVRLQGAIDLVDVSFGYNPVESPLITGFSLSVLPGQRVALVGGSGSGKSTLAKLVSGLYQPTGGDVRFDGAGRAAWPQAVLANSIALVDQDIVLFSGPVRDNLTLWDDTVAEETLVAACRDAAIHDVILALPGGYDAVLGEGGIALSGGQRQRLEIARALVGNPAILIMDEATSALDAETEAIIDRNLRRRGCTCLIVAHRLSTFRDCDEIIVLDRGQAVQRGTHDALSQTDGLYRSLVLSEQEAFPPAAEAVP